MGKSRQKSSANGVLGMTAPQQLHCAACSHRFGKRSRSVLLFGSFVLCLPCAASTTAHRRMFPGCPQHHTPLDHNGDVVTIGIARQILTTTPERR